MDGHFVASIKLIDCWPLAQGTKDLTSEHLEVNKNGTIHSMVSITLRGLHCSCMRADEFCRDAPGVEVIQPGEEELKKKTAQHFCALQSLQFQQTHHCMRATHLKTQGVCCRSRSRHMSG